MSERGRWQGMLTIARFNWPFYAGAAALLVLSLGSLAFALPAWTKVVLACAGLGCAYFLFVSLGVSHLIYDRSDLYRWQWLRRALGDLPPRTIIFCHSGFDEASEALQELLPQAEWHVLDHFDAARMTEPSIRRARAFLPPTPTTVAAPFDRWPLADASADVVFGLLAIHEFRPAAERTAWFEEARRCLRAGGRVFLVEHLRDWPNFLAFGPGFWHFHSRASWEACWSRAGLRVAGEGSLTPWVRLFVLTP